jgi:hypothetical protein
MISVLAWTFCSTFIPYLLLCLPFCKLIIMPILFVSLSQTFTEKVKALGFDAQTLTSLILKICNDEVRYRVFE